MPYHFIPFDRSRRVINRKQYDEEKKPRQNHRPTKDPVSQALNKYENRIHAAAYATAAVLPLFRHQI